MRENLDRPFNASLRRYVLKQLNIWESRIERGDDLRTAWLMRSLLRGILCRAGYIVVRSSNGLVVR